MMDDDRPRYGVELELLETVAVPTLRSEIESGTSRILVIDEIGPMQLLSGTIVARSFAETDELKKRPGVETFLLTEANRTSLATMMALYLQSEHLAAAT